MLSPCLNIFIIKFCATDVADCCHSRVCVCVEKRESSSYFWQLISILIGIGAYINVMLAVTSPIVRRHTAYRNMLHVIQLIAKPLINHLVKFGFARPLHSPLSLANALSIFVNIHCWVVKQANLSFVTTSSTWLDLQLWWVDWEKTEFLLSLINKSYCIAFKMIGWQ